MNIYDFFNSITLEKETISKYIIEGTISKNNFDIIKKYLLEIDEKYIKVSSVILYNNTNYYYPFNSLEVENQTSIKLTIEKNHNNEKECDNYIPIFKYSLFQENYIRKMFVSKNIFTTIKNLFTKNIILLEHEKYIFNLFIDTNILNKKSIIKSLKKISDLEIPSNFFINPFNINKSKLDSLKEKNSVIYNDFLSILNFWSFIYINSNINIEFNQESEQEEFNLTINGYKEIHLSFCKNKIFNQFSDDGYYNIFLWIFKTENKKSDNSYERLEILKNLISLSANNEDLIISIGKNESKLIDKAKSNYKVYLRSATKEYLDMRIKVEEQINKLLDRLTAEYTLFTNTFKQNLYLALGLLISTMIFFFIRFNIRHESASSILSSDNLSIIIFIYGLFSLVFFISSIYKLSVYIGQSDLDLFHIKKKYVKFLDKKDLELIIGDSYKRKKTANNKIIIMLSFFWLILISTFILNNVILKNLF